MFKHRSADFQVCCSAGFQTRRATELFAPCRLGSRRYSRFGNLRYLEVVAGQLRLIFCHEF